MVLHQRQPSESVVIVRRQCALIRWIGPLEFTQERFFDLRKIVHRNAPVSRRTLKRRLQGPVVENATKVPPAGEFGITKLHERVPTWNGLTGYIDAHRNFLHVRCRTTRSYLQMPLDTAKRKDYSRPEIAMIIPAKT